jgi:SHS2 domain-containing protein
MKQYEFIDHTADIIARAHGATLPEAFASAARAMFDVITGGADIRTDIKFEVEVASIDREGLLVGFLSDLIVIHETENVVLGEFEIELSDASGLHAIVRGERFDPDRHGEGTQVKGISYHLMEIVENDNDRSWTVQVLFDV